MRNTAQNFSTLVYKHNCEMLRWRKDVHNWACTICPYVEGGDSKAKGMLAAFEMVFFKSLPASREQIIKMAVSTDEVQLDFLDPVYYNDGVGVLEMVIKLVATDSTTSMTKHMARLSKQALLCAPK